MNKTFTSILLFTACLALAQIIPVQAQQKKEGYTSTLKKAEKYFDRNEYARALPLFQEILVKDTANAYVLFNTGICQLFMYKPQDGLKNILAAQRHDPNVDSHFFFWLARAYHLSGKPAEAIENYKKSIQVTENNDKDYNAVAEKFISELHRNQSRLTFKSPFRVKNVREINSPYSEHSTVLTQDGKTMIFTSHRPISALEKPDEAGAYFDKLFTADFQPQDSTWVNVRPLDIDINYKKKAHYATIQLIDNDQRLLLYKSDKRGDDLYVSNLKDGKWSAPEKMFNRPISHLFQPEAFITRDGNRILFATSMKESMMQKRNNDLDLYEATLIDKSKNKWSKPKKLNGLAVETSNERSPYLLDDTTLIFSSDGYDSYGGFDIFITHYDKAKNEWKKPQNLGQPLNSAYDDIFYTPTDNPKVAYVTLKRNDSEGGGDIYRLQRIVYTDVKGVIAVNGKPAPGTELVFRNIQNPQEIHKVTADSEGNYATQITAGELYNVWIVRNSNDTILRETINYNANVNLLSLRSPLTKSKQAYVKNYDVKTQDSTSVVASSEKVGISENTGKTITESTGKMPKTALYRTATLGDFSYEPLEEQDMAPDYKIYFNVNKFNTSTSESRQKLDEIVQLLKQDKTLKFVIEGHADKTGADEYNWKLSQNRAKAAYKYLVAKGVSPKRLTVVHYGFHKPAADNESTEGRTQNRRVEFKKRAK